jgi:hypothetical protein
MDGSSQTSFIPKRPLVPTEGVSYERKGVSIVTVITVILFLGAVSLSAGSYFYQKFLLDALSKKKDTLQQARKGFDIDTIKELKRLDTRIETAKNLLDQHMAISGVFDILQQTTLKTISYSSFSLVSVAASDSGDVAAGPGAASSIQIKMSGVAQSFNSVALQSDLLVKTRGIKEPIFSNVALDQKGNVSFSVSALIDPFVLRYRNVNGYEVSSSAGTTTKPVNQSSTSGILPTQN